MSFSTTRSTSARVLYLLKENLTVTWFGLLFIARITCEPCSAPLVQALPPEAQIWLISRLNKSISDFSDFGKETLNTVYRELPSGSPLKEIPFIDLWRLSIIYSFIFLIYALSASKFAVASSRAFAKPTIP